jgi:16S rRNA (adenine1518-N6/adenine1519-N6)-dimethyltransferase
VKHKARKRFGQNFLTDDRVIQRIVEVINPRVDQLMLEIGPGQAALTAPLADSGVELHLVELDRDLVALLARRFEHLPNVFLHEADALKVDFSSMTGNRPFRLVGNLPYNISTPLLFHVLQWSDLIVDMHFMLQQEVVNRMAAEPGTKAWGRLSIMCQYRCQVTPLFDVRPESFSPPPRVHSAIVRLVPHRQPPVQIDSLPAFERLVSQAFSMRRKTLRNCMRDLIETDQIEAAGIDPAVRPETLSLQQFAKLSNLMEG